MFDEQVKLIERRMKALFPTLEPNVGIAYDNIEFTPDNYEEFIRPMVTQTDTTINGPGSNQVGCYREHGLLTVQCHIRKGENSVRCAEIARKVADIYRGWASGNLNCETPRVVRIGEVEERFRYDMLITFYYDYKFAQSN